jgi:N-acetylmuramoyl-L-alanine amidase
MKKIAAVVLAFSLLASTAGNSYSFAVNTVSRSQIATGFLTDVKYSSSGNSEAVSIYARKYEDYSVMELTSPKRIVVDIFNAQSTGKQQVIQSNGNIIKRIRYAQFDTYTARVVLEVSGDAEYGIEKTDTGLMLYIGEKPGAHEQEEEEEIPPAVSNVDQQTITIQSKFKIQYGPNGTGEDVSILLGNYAGYQVTRLTDPDRLVVNIPNPKYTGTAKLASVNGSQLKSIDYVKTSKNGAVITLGLNTQSRYSISEGKGKLVLSLQPSAYRHIKYHSSGDRVYFELQDALMTSGSEFLQELYTGSYDETGLVYTVTFPTGQADLGNGVMNINDTYLKSVEVKTNPEVGTTSLIFNGAGKYLYFPYTRNNPGITAITVLKPAAAGQKIVAIDAGHGAQMTGAIYKSLYEKDLNLDIAKRLNTLLEKKGVNTYMIRDDDSDVANYERAYIANKLGACLYLSIHNNAMDNTSYSGTMSLYCPTDSSSGFTGKDFAGIIQSKLLARLGTVNRDIRERPDLIVLKATNMPAALAEVAYITNSADRSNLQKTSFRQNAAQALCDSVVKALTVVNR